MDKNLKKLNRVQLLQLLVQLSQDRDALAAENVALHKQLSERPATTQPIVAQSMKVGSIAEAALQANGYFESAQNAADDYLREIKRMRDQIAARAKAANVQQAQPAQQVQPAQQASEAPQVPDVQATSQASLGQQVPEVLSATQAPALDPQQVEQAKTAAAADAKAVSDRILARANAQAKAIIDDAQNRFDAIIADANRQSHTIISRANRQAEAMVGAAKQQAAAVAPQPAQQQAAPEAGEGSDVAAAPELAQIASLRATPQQQVPARTDEPPVSPSTTAEIKMRARHVRVASEG